MCSKMESVLRLKSDTPKSKTMMMWQRCDLDLGAVKEQEARWRISRITPKSSSRGCEVNVVVQKNDVRRGSSVDEPYEGMCVCYRRAFVDCCGIFGKVECARYDRVPGIQNKRKLYGRRNKKTVRTFSWQWSLQRIIFWNELKISLNPGNFLVVKSCFVPSRCRQCRTCRPVDLKSRWRCESVEVWERRIVNKLFEVGYAGRCGQGRSGRKRG